VTNVTKRGVVPITFYMRARVKKLPEMGCFLSQMSHLGGHLRVALYAQGDEGDRS
jgi:hypothetical protein